MAEPYRHPACSPEAIERAAFDLLDRMVDTYTARNGKRVGIQDDGGEKCWIVPHDAVDALRNALDKSAASEPQSPSSTPAVDQVEAVVLLAAYRPPEMTAETVPHWIKELTPAEYAARRNEENQSALFSLSVSKDWLSVAASMLSTAGCMNPSEYGSYGHSCLIVADALMETRKAILAAMPIRPDTGMREDMVLVPRVPTEAMLEAGKEAWLQCDSGDYEPGAIAEWTAMIDAAVDPRQALASAPVGGVDLAPICLKCGQPKSDHTEGAGGLLCADGNHTFLEDQAPN